MVSNVKFRGKARSLVGQRVNFRPNRFATLKIQIKIGVNGLTAVAAPQFSRGPTNLTLHTAMCCVVCILYSQNRRTPAIRPPTDCLTDWHVIVRIRCLCGWCSSTAAVACCQCTQVVIEETHALSKGSRKISVIIIILKMRDMCTKYVSPSHTYTDRVPREPTTATLSTNATGDCAW